MKVEGGDEAKGVHKVEVVVEEWEERMKQK